MKVNIRKPARGKPGVRYHLLESGSDFLQELTAGQVAANKISGLADGMVQYLRMTLTSQDQVEKFWKGIPAALAGCPQEEDFAEMERILAYGVLHLLDRYLRTWEVLHWLVRTCVLPAPKTNPAVLDIGSGPATASFAVCDFYQALSDYSRDRKIERLVLPSFDAHPIERSALMCQFFNHIAELSNRNGPFRPLIEDFTGFDPHQMRAAAQREQDDIYWDNKSFKSFVDLSEIREWARELHRYQLVFFSNFLTTLPMLSLFKREVQLALRNQRRGGVVVVMGGTGGDYPTIYEELNAIMIRTGHRRVQDIPEVLKDDFRRPYFEQIKKFNNDVWTTLSEIADVSVLPHDRYPPIWDPNQPITGLRSYSVRVFRMS